MNTSSRQSPQLFAIQEKRAAQAFDLYSNLWQQSRFMAIRDAFREEWSPRGGIEDALLDTAAQAYTAWQVWMNRLHWRTELEAACIDPNDDPSWQRPRVSEAEAVREAAEMADRFHRIFLRTLRALRDHRRHPVVLVQNAGQVNVGERQVNMAGH